jgi:hypothetical protein
MTSVAKRLTIGLILFVLALYVPAWAQIPPENRPGVAVDSHGSAAVDPTRNVLDLVLAAVKRLDDIMDAIVKRQDDLRGASDKLNQVRLDSAVAERNVELKRVDGEAKLRADYEEKLRNAEAKRIDAIRLVDVGAATTLAQRTTEQATALATVVTQTAEVVRNQVTRAAEETRTLVATTAAAALQNQQQQFSAVTTRLAALEQAGAEGKGKQTVTDPALLALVQEVKNLSVARINTVGVDTGRNDVIGWIAAGMMFLFAAGGFFLTITRRPLQSSAKSW